MNRKTVDATGQRLPESNKFHGFTRLDANFLYCPNQFLDVCLPHSSRSVVRLVAFILDQTLGWLDEHGNPISQNITVSFNQLIRSAGISRGAIRKSIDDAIAGGFICCVREGKPAAVGEPPEHATYAIRWDDSGQYLDASESFEGFYAGDGYRTPIPNAYFRHVVPNETLTVTKVVGTVLRHTVGYQNHFGGRRPEAPLSYRFIQRFANIPDPKTLSAAISSAIASQYIVCIDEGVFHQDQNLRRPATYAVKWLSDAPKSTSGSKKPAGGRFNKPSSPPVQKTQQDQSNIPSSSGSENPAGGRFRKPSKEKTGQKNTLQQHSAAADKKGFQLLCEVGFDEKTAEKLSEASNTDVIERQIKWIGRRKVEQNRLGMLRRAIEENWPEPDRPKDAKMLNRELRERDRKRAAEEEREERKLLADKTQRIGRRAELQKNWDDLSDAERKRIESAAYDNQNSEMLRRLFQRSESHRLRECFRQLDREKTSGESTSHS
ncbi:hypothetical protein Mal52_13280 [Symmachiella dynata]|uniref:Uncharacterized protein n=1 Tax=Symmachiella dynata TaxID=2527995 RepID=A0A517ZK33_9PLAN|nr:hypothetical protein [Symmachiella dynata]QDU42859.1 hypothetical protein Mal52_13280 [Symmachiella dynata]